MIYLAEILFVALNVGMAAWEAHLIHQERPIKHGWWALLYVALIAAVWFWQKNPVLCVCAVLIREVVFSPALSYFRELPFFYRSKTTGSVIDKWEGALIVPVYIASAVALIILQFTL